MDQHWEIPAVNAGRAATPIGGDEIHPWILVREWQARLIKPMLRKHRIPFDLRVGYSQTDDDRLEEQIRRDRFSFPGGDAHQLQELFKTWRPYRG